MQQPNDTTPSHPQPTPHPKPHSPRAAGPRHSASARRRRPRRLAAPLESGAGTPSDTSHVHRDPPRWSATCASARPARPRPRAHGHAPLPVRSDAALRVVQSLLQLRRPRASAPRSARDARAQLGRAAVNVGAGRSQSARPGARRTCCSFSLAQERFENATCATADKISDWPVHLRPRGRARSLSARRGRESGALAPPSSGAGPARRSSTRSPPGTRRH
jgi:hypothetical protein